LRLFGAALLLLTGPTGLFVDSVLSAFAAASLANAITVRIYERGRLSDLGLDWRDTSLREFGIGLGLAALAAAVILGGSVLSGLARFEPKPEWSFSWPNLIFGVVLILFGAVGEEMFFRGYGFQLLIRSIGAFATILPISVIFGLMHAANP